MLALDFKNGIARCHFDIGSINVFAQSDIDELDQLLTRCEQQPDIKLLAFDSRKISPRGFPIFCAGANQKERVTWSNEKILSHLKHQRNVIHRLRTSHICIVCCVQGLALGLGTEICLASDFVLASDNAEFAFPEKEWGIVPGAGGYAWAHGWASHPEEAQSIIQSGRHFDREYAQWLGIVDALCEENDFELMCQFILENISTNFSSFSSAKKHSAEKIDFKQFFELEQSVYAQCLLKKRTPENFKS